MSITTTTFGQWMRQKREERGYSVRECAIRAGIKEPVWSNFENDRSRRSDGQPTRPMPETIKKIARGLRVNSEEVFRAAGYLPNEQDAPDPADDRMKEMMEHYSGAPPVKQELAYRVFREIFREDEDDDPNFSKTRGKKVE